MFSRQQKESLKRARQKRLEKLKEAKEAKLRGRDSGNQAAEDDLDLLDAPSASNTFEEASFIASGQASPAERGGSPSQCATPLPPCASLSPRHRFLG